MRKLVILGLILASVPSVAHAKQHPSEDGYSFEKREFTMLNINVQVIEHENLAELRAAMPEGYNTSTRNNNAAWTDIYPNEKRCVIHIVKPEKDYRPKHLGHELAHCLYGRWHD